MKRATSYYGQRAVLLLGMTALLCSALPMPARAVIYHGAPNLPLAVSLVVAGGGPRHFSSQLLYKNLTGSAEPAETVKLRAKYGDAAMDSAFAIMDYAIGDVLRILTEAKVKLPAPDPRPDDPRSLARALYAAGITGSGKWDVGFMLERIISHPVHHVIMHDLDKHFTHPVNANFHTILAEMMHDVNGLYDGPAAAPQATEVSSPNPAKK